jgi:hypothetical protein
MEEFRTEFIANVIIQNIEIGQSEGLYREEITPK